MADHLRRRIRDEIAAVLDGLATTGTNVFPSRRYPFQAEDLPGIAIYTAEEASGLETMGTPAHLVRDLDLIVEAVTQVEDATALDDTLDLMATEIETAIGTAVKDRTSVLRGLIRSAVLTRTQIALQPAKEAELRTGSIVLTYRVTYRTRSDDPTTIN